MRGWVTIASTTDEPQRRFAVGTVIEVDRPRTILDVRFGPRLAVLFEGCTTREDAEELRGLWLHLDVVDSPEDPDEFYDHQLEGLAVLIDGVQVGVIREVLHLPGQDLLDVDLGERTVLVPFVEQIVPRIDLDAGQVHVSALEGLFDDAD